MNSSHRGVSIQFSQICRKEGGLITSTNQKRALIVSAAIILLCLTVIVGLTFALFTDGDQVKNHLQAGDLEILLTRTNLEYRYLDTQGQWKVATVEGDFDFTTSNDDNVFGLDSRNIVIVPGCYFNADMKVENVGNVAFTYYVRIDLRGQEEDTKVNALAEQLDVTITYADGTVTKNALSEMLNGHTVLAGTMLENDPAQTFNVEVYFRDDTTINNAAQTQLAEFDLIVSAVQIPPPQRESN